MNTSRAALPTCFLILGVALIAGLSGCQRQSAPETAATTVVRSTSDTPAVTRPGGVDASVPEASRVLVQESPASQSAAGAVNQRNDLNRDQEAKSMPLAGQANDHSNLAQDKKPAASEPAR